MQIHAERNTIIKDRDRTDSYSSFTHEAIISLMIASCVKLEDLINIHFFFYEIQGLSKVSYFFKLFSPDLFGVSLSMAHEDEQIA